MITNTTETSSVPTLKSLGNSILFKFEDAVNSKGEFVKNNTSTGVILQSTVDDSAKSARWAVVLFAGPDCKSLVAGDRILLPALRWTTHIVHAEQKLWKSDESEVALKVVGGKLLPLNDHVVFIPTPANKLDSTLGGLIVVLSSPSNTPSGTIVYSLPEHTVQPADVIFYLDPNFNGDFVFNQEKLAFIKEHDILLVKSPTDQV